MDMFVEPIRQIETISLPESSSLKETAEDLALLYGININWVTSEKRIENTSDLLIQFANRLAWQRERSAEPLKKMKDFSADFKDMEFAYFRKSVALLGSGMLVEALAKHFSVIEWTIRAISSSENDIVDFEPGECFIFTGDALAKPELLKYALEQKPAYVGLVASFQNATNALEKLGMPMKNLKSFPFFIPAGLDIGAKNPYEVALSVVAEILKQMRALQ